MLRLGRAGAILVGTCAIAACGSSGDDMGDAAEDAPAMGDATIDTGGGMKDSGGGDSTTDSSAMDASADSPGDAIADAPVLDAPIDAPILDAGGADGGGCSTNNDCTKSDYCEKGTNNCAGNGSCIQKPQFCPQIFMPVCGCDKKTYSNSCYAHAAGVSVWYTSACE